MWFDSDKDAWENYTLEDTLTAREEIKEFYRKRFEKQEEALRIAVEALEYYEGVDFERKDRRFADKGLPVPEQSGIAHSALQSIHSLQSDE